MSEPTLLYTSDIEAAKAEILAVSGAVTQIFNSCLFEARLPDGFAAETLSHSSTAPPGEVDETTALLARAWKAIEAESRIAEKGLRGGGEEVIKWDDPRFQPPGKIQQPPFRARGEEGLDGEDLPAPTSLRMLGSVAVGLIVVSGTGVGLGFTDAQKLTVVQQVMRGLQFLSGAAPFGTLTFVYEIRFLTVDAPPPASCGDYEPCEAVWRDPALVQLGFRAGHDGCVDFADALRRNHRTDWSYIAFFTHYPLYHFAYAGGVRLCMQYENDGWGPEQIDRVFAHETCHIFGAADEYGDCKCEPRGELGIPNNNCRNCTTSQVLCLMDGNPLTMCKWTRGQIGWWPRVGDSFGAVAVEGKRPHVFVTRLDGNLWLYKFSGSIWEWSNQALPPGVDLDVPMGAVAANNLRPHLFVIASDGNMWLNWWSSGTAWGWANLRRPRGHSLDASMGAVIDNAGRPHVFATSEDGNLWTNWWSGKAWAWIDHGHPTDVSLEASMGAVTVNGGWPFVFVLGGDGNLWVKWWSGSAWAWAKRGKPHDVKLGASMGAVTLYNRWPYVFVMGSDKNLWLNRQSETGWEWVNQRTPGVALAASMGAVTVADGRGYVFVMGVDGNLWVNSWWDDNRIWANHGRPKGLDITSAMGAILVGDRTHVFVKCSDENLWVNLWSGSDWQWEQRTWWIQPTGS